MNRATVGVALTFFLAATGAASANTITGQFTGSGASTSLNLTNNGSALGAGVLNHTFLNNGTGDAAHLGGNLRLFCIDNRTTASGDQVYTVRDVTLAPVGTNGNFGTGGGNYTNTEANRLDAVARFFLSNNLIDSRGSASLSLTNTEAAAMQLLIWEALWETSGNPWSVDVGTGGHFAMTADNAAVRTQFDAWAASIASSVGSYSGRIVRALTVQTGGDVGQDQMVLIPLPPAAWAGLSTLAGVGFVGYIRRRKNTAQ